MYIVGLDLESTGLHYDKGDRIIETCAQLYDFKSRKKLIDLTQKTNPEGKAINKKAGEVHGITAADLVGKPTFKEFAPKLTAVLKRSSGIVTHNGEWFDIPFLMHELGMAGEPLPVHLVSFDTMQNGMFASYDSKPPSLQELCWAMGVEYDPAKAHAAQYDVDVMMESFFKAVDMKYFDTTTLEGK